MREASQGIRVVHPADRSAREAYFSAEIPGNMVTRFGLVEVGGPCLQLAYAETDAGAQFPLQYHRGGTELAVMISGEGTIVTDDQKEYPFEGGDIVIVPADITYRVVNRGEGNCSRGFSSQKERNPFGLMVLRPKHRVVEHT